MLLLSSCKAGRLIVFGRGESIVEPLFVMVLVGSFGRSLGLLPAAAPKSL